MNFKEKNYNQINDLPHNIFENFPCYKIITDVIITQV